MARDENLFRRLTRLFRSGPVVKRKIRALDTAIAVPDKSKSSGTLLFQKSLAPTYATITANAYNLSERLMRYQDFQEMEYCLTGDTLIAVPDGYRRIDELAAECAIDVEKQFIVYAYDHNQRKIVPAWGKQARQTRVDHAWRVTFDSGKQITGSGNHRLMLRDGTYCRIDRLKVGDAMMPFHRKDLFARAEEGTKGYSWVYTMDGRFRGWTKEHQLIAEWIAGRELTENECVHHINFVKTDNRPENLLIMEKSDHSSLHARINNQNKWSAENAEWIIKFKQRHSEFMRQHNPAQRTDITFGRILETCERVGFNIRKLSEAFDTDPNVIKRRLLANGFDNFQTFALAYDPPWRNGGWDNAGALNPRYDSGLTFEAVCSAFERGMSAKQLATKLGTTDTKVVNRVKSAGYVSWTNFSQTYQNHKVVSVEYVGVVPLYDLTVDGYKNFATDSVVSHNTPEIAAAMDIYADESCLSGDSIVALLDGSRPTIREHFESGRENFEVYSFDISHNRIVPGQATRVVKTGTKRIFRINLDDGTSLRLTDNHRVLLSDGTYEQVGKLKIGSSLRSLYTRLSSKEQGDHIYGYEQALQPNGWNYTHRIVAEHTYPDIKGVVSIVEEQDEDVFDLEVSNWHNFAVTASPESTSFVFVHNCAQDDKGRVLHIYSDNEKIKEVLEDLFYNTLNVEFNMRSWARNLVKYGDLFLFNDVSPQYGVINAFPIPVNEIEREENYDRDDPFAVRFRWVTLGNRVLENWEVSHFRLLGNDMFLPYGSSIIEPARRIWRQLILIEDAMLVYRVVRAPERRVFYIDVANISPNDVPTYIEEQKKNLRSSQVIDKTTGRVDLRYNPLSVDEDYFIPVRGGDTGTKIDTLAGGQNAAAVEDVAYIQKKLFAALKIPRAYLGYDELLSSKATLAQEDIRFSRSINVIQKTIIAELNKLAIIHLYANGFTDDDLVNFTLRLSNPSTVAQQQKLELWRSKFEIAGSVPEGYGSKQFVYKNIWSLTDEEIKDLNKERLNEKMIDAAIEKAGEGGEGGEEGGGSDTGGGELDLLGTAGGEETAPEETPETETTPDEENAGEEPEEEQVPGTQLLTSGDDVDDKETFNLPSATDSPVKVQNQLKRAMYNRSRQRTHGASKTHMPDFNKMTNNDSEAMQDPYDASWMRSVISNPMGESAPRILLSPDVSSALNKFSKHKNAAIQALNANQVILVESPSDFELDEQPELLSESSMGIIDGEDEV